MTANVIIVVDKKSDVLLIPARFVSEVDGKSGAFVLGQGGKVEFRPVEIGLRGSDGQVEIISGLREGDRVIFVET